MGKPKEGQGVPPITIPFFSTGLYTYRSQLFAPYRSIGINVVIHHDALLDGQDMEVNDLLEIQRRPGYSRFSSIPLLDGELLNQFDDARTLEGSVLSFFDSSIRWALFTPTAITTLLTKATSLQGFQTTVGNITFFSDGVDFVKLDQWGNVTPWGIAAPTGTPTLTGQGFWQKSRAYALNSGILDTNGNIQTATTGTFPSGTIEPVWATTFGGITQDGYGLQWTNRGPLGTWFPLTNYQFGSVIVDSNGNLQLITTEIDPPLWDAGHTYAVGDQVYWGGQWWTANKATTNDPPAVNNIITSGSTSAPFWIPTPNPVLTGTTQPTWATAFGNTTSDGSFTWTNCGQGFVLAQAGYEYVYALRTIYGDLSTSSPTTASTGPILGPQYANVTAFTIASNVVTFTASNNFVPGNIVSPQGFVTSTFLNNVSLTVNVGATATQFSANFTHADTGPISETALVVGEFASISGPGVANALLNQSVTITSAVVTGNVATISFTGGSLPKPFPIGGYITLVPGTAIFLDGQFQVLTCTTTTFQVLIDHADYPPTVDSGTATFDAIEIYRTADGGGIYYAAGAVENPGGGSTWNFDDFTQDSSLNTLLIAPLAHANDPPPNAPGSTYNGGPGIIYGVRYWQGRVWIAIDDYVVFSAGPDCINGDPYSTFPPSYAFKFSGPISGGISPTDRGMVVHLADRNQLILGGPQTATFYPWDFMRKVGVSSPNCVVQDGQTIWMYTTQGQLRRLDGGNDSNEGTYIADLLMDVFPPGSSYLTIHRNGLDEGLFLSNGTDSVIRLGVNIPCWSPIAKPVGGAHALRSVETGIGTYSLMLGQPLS